MQQVYSFYFDAFRIAVQSILEHKLRAILTLIGIIIGVAAVVVVGASISGLNSYVSTQIGKVLGVNHFMMTRMAFSQRPSDEEFERINRRNKKITWEEFEYIKEGCRTCSEVGAQMQNNADLNQNGIEMPAIVVNGVTANFIDIEDKEISEGRFFTPDEVSRSARVCILQGEVRDKFFEDRDPIGQTLKVNGLPLTVVGVEKKRGSFLGTPLDRGIYIPVTLLMQLFGRGDGVQLHGKTLEKADFKTAMEEAHNKLRDKRGLSGSEEDNFGIVNTEDLGGQIDQFTNAIAAVVVPITMITLIVGGIVVMNIMLVSVTERTFEVGLRKALGATQKQILLQFLIESALLCLVGGILGLILASGVTWIITLTAQISMTITITYIILAVGISSIIGIVAGPPPPPPPPPVDPIIALTKS